VLEVSKSAKTESAVTFGVASCANKFQTDKKTGRPLTELPVCKLYWDGFGFKRGRTEGNNFTRLEISNGALVVEVAFAKKFLETLSVSENQTWSVIPGAGGWGASPHPFAKFMRINFFPNLENLCR